MTASDEARAAAYHGPGWAPRHGTHAEDVARGTWWRAVGVDAEWATLRSVLLMLPNPRWPHPTDWNAAQYLRPVDFGALRGQLLDYAEALTRAGVEVVTATPADDAGAPPRYNGVFARDQFFMTPDGAVVARMASQPRAGEERWITQALAAAGVPIVATIRGDGCFEGADALWLGPRVVAVGMGNRTNASGARQLARLLRDTGITVRRVPLPRTVQHLLGLFALVDRDLAVVRAELVPPELLGLLDNRGIRVVGLPESSSVTAGQAMNFVPLGPRRIVMVAGSPAIERLLERHGVEVYASVDCPALLNAAGGLACATGVLRRTWERPS